jgi:uncharacterized protein (TIGR03086 family)
MEPVADRYRRLSDQLTERIAAVPDQAWSGPTPCEGWTVRDLVGHVIDVHGRFQGLVGRSLVDHPSVDTDPLGAWTAVRDQMQADLDDPDRAAEEYDGLLGRSSFGASVDGFVCFDLVVHGWDLARATGQDETLDPDKCAAMLEGMLPYDDMLRTSGQYGPRVEVPEDADVQTKLMAFIGRTPWRR